MFFQSFDFQMVLHAVEYHKQMYMCLELDQLDFVFISYTICKRYHYLELFILSNLLYLDNIDITHICVHAYIIMF